MFVKNIVRHLIIILIFLFVLSMILCVPKETDNATVASKAIFDIPSTITGDDSSAGASFIQTKSISESTKNTVESFFNYARHQIWWAEYWAKEVKEFIVTLETFGFFNLTETYSGTITNGINEGDEYTWNVNGDGTYLFEWFKEEMSQAKFLEVYFSDYSKVDDSVESVAGYATLNINNNPNITDPSDTQKPEWIKITFDAASDGSAYMKIEVDNFLYTTDTDILDGGTDTQECIIEAEKDTSGWVTVTAVNSVNGSKVLNYEKTAEERYYIFTGKGNSSYATVALTMPEGTYNISNVFSGNGEIGEIIKEYWAQDMRYKGENSYSGSVFEALNYLDTINPGSDYLTGAYTSGTLFYTSTTPVTDTIYNDLVKIDNDGYGNEDLENALYLMDVVNSAYFNSSDGFIEYGNAPDSNYPDISSLITNFGTNGYTKDDVNNLSIDFSY